MQIRSLILSVIGGLVALSFFWVVFDSQGPTAGEVDEAELEKAMSAYKRKESKTTSSTTRLNPSIPRAVKKRNNPEAESSGDDDDTPRLGKTYSAPAPEETEEVFAEKVDLKEQMNSANKLYDQADYEGARESALEILKDNPETVRMQRIVVSASCIMGDEDIAVEHYQKLPPRDQRQMARRCKRYNIEF